MMGGPMLDDEPENVFRQSSRVNSTWGGNLVDMVRCRRYLEIMEEERLVGTRRETGKHSEGGGSRSSIRPPRALLGNARGRGLMCAIDFLDGAARDASGGTRCSIYGMIILPCGMRGLRFRPPLDVTTAEIDESRRPAASRVWG